MTTALLAVALLLAAVIGMAVKVLLVKGGRFPSGHVHDLPQLRRQRCRKQS